MFASMKRFHTVPLAMLLVTNAPAGEKLADCPELRQLEARWRDAMPKMCTPSIAVAVVKGDQVLVCDALGQRDVDPDHAANADTMYYIASCTKAYVATGLAVLESRGKVNLDAPVKQYLPRFELADSQASRTITVGDLLCHKPGLNNWAIVFNDAFSGLITEDIYYRRLATCTPGSPEYSNIHFTLAGRVMESVTGKSWKIALDDVLFKPAGMTQTTADADKAYADKNVAMPLMWRDGGFIEAPRKSSRSMHAAGGLVTTARDAARMLLMSINGGMIDGKQVIPPDAMKKLLTPRQTMPPEGKIRHFESFGLGWRLGTYRGRPYAAHQGGYAGTSAHLSFLPEDRIGVAILINAGGPASGFMDVLSIDVLDALLGLKERDLLPTYLEEAAKFPAEAARFFSDCRPIAKDDLSIGLDACVGEYSHPDFGTLKLVKAGATLTYELGDLRGDVLASPMIDSMRMSFQIPRFTDGRLEIDGGRVRAVVFDFPSGAARFAAVN